MSPAYSILDDAISIAERRWRAVDARLDYVRGVLLAALGVALALALLLGKRD